MHVMRIYPARTVDAVSPTSQHADFSKLLIDAIQNSPSAQIYIKRMGGNYAVLSESEDAIAAIVEIGEDRPDHFELGLEMKITRDGRVWVRGTAPDRGDDWHIDYQPQKTDG